jgi:hypothetical protein
MKYTKPCILNERNATSTIQSSIAKQEHLVPDHMLEPATTSAYEADE